MGFISWIIMGAVAGWLASRLAGTKSKGCFFNILLGIVGSIIGGFIFHYFNKPGITGFNFWSLFVATVGAMILLFLANLFSGKNK